MRSSCSTRSSAASTSCVAARAPSLLSLPAPGLAAASAAGAEAPSAALPLGGIAPGPEAATALRYRLVRCEATRQARRVGREEFRRDPRDREGW